MLRKKARPRKRLLKINTSKEYFSSLFSIYHDIMYTNNTFGKALLNSIPVLSIFVLLGIMGYATIVIGFGGVDGEVLAETYTDSNTSLIIDNDDFVDNVTTEGNTIYSSHTVQIKADNIAKYTLTINGPIRLSGDTTITGADNKTLADMETNTWGYAWDNTTVAEEDMTYASFTGSDQTITKTTSTTDAINNPIISKYAIDFTRKLVFAAKFADTAASGHYKANVKLNLTVTPRALMGYAVFYDMNGGTGGPDNTSGIVNGNSYTYTIPDTVPTTTQSGYKFDGYNTDNSTKVEYWPGDTVTIKSTNPNITLFAVYKLSAFPSSLSTMQGMTASICDSVATGVEKSLTDSGRGNTQYTVRKLTDGNCWMVDNLKLDLSSYTLTSANSDVTSNYVANTATNVTNVRDWSGTESDNKAQFNMDGLGDSTIYKSNYGYYYSWCAATAGTCSSATSRGAEASSSICPKGWRLPKGGSSGDFKTLYDKWTTIWTSVNSINGRWLGASTAATGGVFFLAAGCIYNNTGFREANSYGHYWSRTAYKSDETYSLRLSSSGLNPAYSYYRSFGYSVRCIAYSS